MGSAGGGAEEGGLVGMSAELARVSLMSIVMKIGRWRGARIRKKWPWRKTMAVQRAVKVKEGSFMLS